MNIKPALLIPVLALSLACKKSEPAPKAAPAKPIAAKKAAAPAHVKPKTPKPPEPKKAAKKPVPKKTAPVNASRKTVDEDKSVLKELLDIGSPEVVDSKLPVIVYYYANWSPYDKKMMGIVEDVAAKYIGKAKFYRVDAMAAKKKNVLPLEVVGFPYLIFLKEGKRFGKQAYPGANAKKEVSFAIEDWIIGGDDEDDDSEGL